MLTDIEKIMEALQWLGFSKSQISDCDICENGSVYLGLTQILPPGSVTAPAGSPEVPY
jgi:hypothetical protein